MAAKKALVLTSGEIKELASTDTLTGNIGVDTVISQTSATLSPTQTFGTIVILCNCTSNSITINLPTAVGNTAIYILKKTDSSANTVTVDPNSTQTIDGGSTAVLQVQYESITVVSDNSNWMVI